ncbi:hypothetical protein CFP56_003280 [Quercus suber]|uniref:Uncharacterized protein n=1 Tax=Quercus suber TaxID=58331 RepID=A0AAW0LC82_QUESU
MAEALVGKALLSATLKVLFDKMTSQEVVNFIRGRKIKEVVKKMNYLASQIIAIGLREGVEGRSSQKVPTTSLVDPESIIYGRDDDEKAIDEDGDNIIPNSIKCIIGKPTSSK